MSSRIHSLMQNPNNNDHWLFLNPKVKQVR
jgi:hypothetical protein